jgi:hypothetical protein
MIPSRRLFALYIVTAHVSLALAFLATSWNPYAIAGFFYHARMVAIVHLVTIGWIAMSILGNVYVVLPMAFGVPFPARWADYAAFAFVAIGLVGMVAHFWIVEFGGMAWSAATAACGIAYVAARVAATVRHAKVPGAVKLHIYFASANVLAAATAGVLLGFDKVHSFLPGYVLSNVFAHAHLAAIGWVCMMIMGFGYRLLPMALPASMPSGRTIMLSAVLVETGIIGLFWTLLIRSAWAPFFAGLVVAGFGAFAVHVFWMLEEPKRPPHGRPRPDMAPVHIAAAGVWLGAACTSGLMLTVLPMSDATLRLALLYGTFGLVGCLAQIIVGFEQRILPIAAGYWGLKPVAGPLRRAVAAGLWLFGVPALAGGFFLNAPQLLGTGSTLLLAAATLAGYDVTSHLRLRHYASRPG